jgi:ABC-type lipoprotein release transport system permease subunit
VGASFHDRGARWRAGVQISLVPIIARRLLPALSLMLASGLDARSLAAQAVAATPRTIAIDERLAADAGLRVGDRVVLAAAPGASGDTAVVGAVVRRGADPSEVARAEYRVRMHLDQLQRLIGYGDRVDRFAVATRGPQATDSLLAAVDRAAFGFRAHRSSAIAVETSKTFLVVSRFHKAIGVITIVASATFLLCILLLKVDERRRDVAALRLMGFSRASVVRAVVLEATLVSALGTLLGVGLGWSISRLVNLYYQGVYRTPLTFALVTPDIVLFAAALSLLLGIGAGLLAAMRLASTPPLALFGR